ncbi:hypothetical protein [Clostridium baratii]|uniref:hypothetical protein n=1 Tax=Clostridium baratii TaxID=1561 RepID=UPI0030D410BC
MVIDFSKFNYWGAVIKVFPLFSMIFVIYVGTVFFMKGISITKVIKAFISCIYVSILTPLVLVGLGIIINNNGDIGNISCIIFILGYIYHFYDSIVEVVKIVISRFKEEIKKKNR